MYQEKICIECNGKGYHWKIEEETRVIGDGEAKRSVTKKSFQHGDRCTACNGTGLITLRLGFSGWLWLIVFGLLIGVVLIGQF